MNIKGQQKRVMVNIACGKQNHSDWINLDISASPGVKYHNVKKKLPFKDNSVSIIYHSHILEHLEKPHATKFIKECYRVLEKGGIMRIAVPDFEKMCIQYLKNLNTYKESKTKINYLNYYWDKIEIIDQLSRTRLGGEFSEIASSNPENKEYIKQKSGNIFFDKKNVNKKRLQKLLYLATRFKFRDIIRYIKIYLSKDKARISGEKHYWIYDELDLQSMLEQSHFKEFKRMEYNKSQIPNWESYYLDNDENNECRKPGSMYIEVLK